MRKKLLLFFLPLILFFSFKGDRPVAAIPHGCFDAYNDSSATDLSFFDTIVPKYRLFLFGEIHGVAVNPRLEMKMIRYLYVHGNLRHIVMEYGPAEVFLYQRYLDTGDEYWVEDSWMFKMPEYVRFWRELHAFNQSVKDKIDLVGLDFDSDHLFAKAIASLCPEKRKPAAAIQPMIDSVMALNKRITSFTQRNFIDQFQADFTLHRDLYNDYFGNNFGQVEKFVDNGASYQDFKERDEQMYLNFQQAYGDTMGYFGMFGWSHAYTGYRKSFATMLNENDGFPDLNGKVLGVGICYDSCSYYYNNGESMVLPARAIDYLKAKESLQLVTAFREQAGCNAAVFAIRSVDDPLVSAAASQSQLMIYVRKSRAVGFRK